MKVEASVISGALQSGVTLVTDSVEADRCGIVCLLVKSGLLSGFQVCTWVPAGHTSVHCDLTGPTPLVLSAGDAAIVRINSLSLQGHFKKAGALSVA